MKKITTPIQKEDEIKTSLDFVAYLHGEDAQLKLNASFPNPDDAKRIVANVLTEYKANADLQKCTPSSLITAVIRCAQLGLEPISSLGQVSFVPTWDSTTRTTKCALWIGYRGLILLAFRKGINAYAREVLEGDEFHILCGTEEKIIHKPNMEIRGQKNAKPILYYAVAMLPNGQTQFDFMTVKEIEPFDKKKGAWLTAKSEMSKKTVLRRLLKVVPISLTNTIFEDEDETEFSPPKLVDVTPVENGRTVQKTQADTLAEKLKGLNATTKQGTVFDASTGEVIEDKTENNNKEQAK